MQKGDITLVSARYRRKVVNNDKCGDIAPTSLNAVLIANLVYEGVLLRFAQRDSPIPR